MMASPIQSLVFKDTFISYFPEIEADKMLQLVCPAYKMEWAGVTYRNDHQSPGTNGGKESNPWLDLIMMQSNPGRPQQVDMVVS